MALKPKLNVLTLLLFLLVPALYSGLLAQCEVDAGDDVWICAGEAVTIGGAPTLVETPGGPFNWGWDNGIGEVDNPTVSPTTTTTYTVNINTPGPGFCDEDEVTVFVYPAPTAAFDFAPDAVCASIPIQFTNNSTGVDLTYDWDFGDATFSTASNPSHVFDAIGGGTVTFDVVLTVTDENGCTDTATETVTINEIPDAVLADPTFSFVNCGGEDEFTIAVLDQSTPASNANYTIDWGDGSDPWDSTDSPNPFTAEHTYTGLNIWTLTYTVLGNNGCSSTSEQLVANITNPAIGASTNGNTTVCGPVEICFNLSNFEANHSSTSYAVTFGDGSPAVIYAHPPPAEVCHEYTASSCASGEPYTFEVEATNMCTFSVATISPITIFSPPTAGFYPDPVPQCVNVPVTMVNTSTLGYYTGCGQNGTFFWDFGDETTAFSVTNDNQSHAYAEPGIYTVTLTAYNACNSDDPSIFTQEVCIEEPPTPSFTTSPDGCVPFSIAPTNTSSIGEVCTLSYTWVMGAVDIDCPVAPSYEFINGTTLNDETPEIQINAAGTYELEMTMANSCGVYVYTDYIEAFDIPQVNLYALTEICAGEWADPDAIYEDCNTAITETNWTFESGSPATSTASNPGIVTWATGGVYDVTLETINQCGSVELSTPIVVQSTPNITISSTAGTAVCNGNATTFTASGASTYTWTWDADLSTTAGAVTTAWPDADNTYTVTGYTSAGCPGTETITIDVDPLPIVQPSGIFEMCFGDDVQLGLDVTSGTPPFVTYAWSPGGTLDQTDVEDPVADPLVDTWYDVAVTDVNGCVGWGVVPVDVNPLPIVEAGAPVQLCNQPVAETLTGYSPTSGGTGTWTGTGVTPDGQFTPDGVGPVTLTYTFIDTNGCTNQDDLEVDVIDPIAADAGVDITLCADGVAVGLIPVTPGGTWTGTDVAPDGTFTPTTDGIFELTYTLGGGSCLSTDLVDIEVFALPQVDAGLDVVLCDGDSTLLDGSAAGGLLPYTSIDWLPAPGIDDAGALQTWFTPAGTTSLELSVTDTNGCVGTDQLDITVEPSPVVNAGVDLFLCNQPIPEDLVGFSPLPGAGETGEWTGDDVTTDGIFTPSGVGQTTLYYTFVNTYGCIGIDSIVVDVADPVAADGGVDQNLCVGSPAIQLTQPGVWTGPTVAADGTFDPALPGIYDFILTVGSGTCATTDDLTIEVLELPTVDAGLDGVMCAEGSVQLDATAATPNGTIDTYAWTGDLSISDVAAEDPTVSPSVTTTFTVVVTDSEGCQATDNVDVVVSALPAVNAGPDLTLCDQPIAETLVGFTPLPLGTETGEWTGTGITDPAGTFESPGVGMYWLYYTFTDAGGCSDVDSLLVDVIAPLVADAGPDVVLCQNNGLLELTGFTPALGGTWSGTGIVDADLGVFDPAFTEDGTFDLLLEYGSGTCYTSDIIEVEVQPLPTVDANPLDDLCNNEQPVALAGYSPPGGTWEGPGITDGTLGTYDPGTAIGAFDLIYFFTSPVTGCTDTVEVVQVVHPVPVANFDVAILGCTDADVDLNNTSVGADTYEWDFGNAVVSFDENPSYIYPNEGFFDIELIAINAFGCQDTVLQTNEIIDPPQAFLELSPNEGCAPLEISFTNNSVGQYLTYFWDLSTSTSALETPDPVTYAQGDDVLEYPVSLSATNFCGTVTANDIVTVLPQPIAGFGTDLDVFCSPFTVTINDISTGNPDTWWWDFDDGTFSGSDEPGTHIFLADTVAVDYTISLIVTNECGTDTADYTITVLPNTVTAFFNTDIVEGCEPLEVEFTDFSEGGTAISYDFGDTFLSADDSPTHTFNDPGTYMVQQFVTNGCSFDTSEVVVTVFEAADLSFLTDVPEACGNAPVQFINTSEGVASVSWDFGDGEESDLTNPIHTYEEGGTYTVTLSGATLFTECPAEVQAPFTINPVPVSGFDVDATIGCSPYPVDFTNTSTGGLFYTWNFGDGNIGDGLNPTHTYVNPGGAAQLVTVTMVATNAFLCSDSTELDLIIAPTPVALFDLSDTESCTFPFAVQTFNNSLFGTSYSWDFGTFGTSALTNPNVIYTEEGTFPVSLTVSNVFGCVDTAVDEVSIFPSPDAWFGAPVNDGCVPLEVAFVNETVGGVDYVWSFEGGSDSFATDPLQPFNSPGSFDVTLMATNAFGCTDQVTFEDYINVYPLPFANFSMSTWQTDVYSPVVNFYDASAGAVQWIWNYGDGQEDIGIQNPVHGYQGAGLFTAELTVLSEHGCVSSTTRSLTIDDRFGIYVPNTFTPDDDGINDVFFPQISGKDLIEEYEFAVYDRWGHQVFYTEDPYGVWVGDFKGNNSYYVQDDVYVWQVKMRIKGEDESRYLYGHVTQLR